MKKGWLRHLDFITVDIISCEIALLLAFGITDIFVPVNLSDLWQLFLFFPLIHLFVSIMLDAYNGILQRGYLKETGALLKLECIVFSLFMLFFYFMRILPDIPRRIILFYFLFHIPLAYVWRFFHKFFLRKYYYKRIKNTRQIVVVSTEALAQDMIHTITRSAIRNYQFFGLVIVDRSMIGENIAHVTVAADKDTLVNYLKDCVVDEVFINVPHDPQYTLELAQLLLEMGITAHIYMENIYQSLPNRSIGNVFGYNVLTTTLSPISFRQELFKRLFDITGGIVGCIITIFISIFLGPVIFIKSPGPVFFSQTRIGKSGRPFKIYKFRSMYMDAEERKKDLMEQNKLQNSLMFKIDDDPRIIKGIGNFIRRTSLDEFPQFWNVLKGDMSLVGTRPPTIDEYQQYSPHHKRRLNMRPGITGLWQVSGRSTITDFEEVVRLDTQYIQNWSLDLDIKIIFKTVLKLFRKNNDAF